MLIPHPHLEVLSCCLVDGQHLLFTTAIDIELASQDHSYAASCVILRQLLEGGIRGFDRPSPEQTWFIYWWFWSRHDRSLCSTSCTSCKEFTLLVETLAIGQQCHRGLQVLGTSGLLHGWAWSGLLSVPAWWIHESNPNSFCSLTDCKNWNI